MTFLVVAAKCKVLFFFPFDKRESIDMNPKLVLAESLETLRKAEAKESEADKLQEAIAKSSSLHGHLSKLKRLFTAVYDTYIRGLEMMNFVRRWGITANEHDLVRFCELRMCSYMDRCEALRTKEANILVPISELDAVVKSGYKIKDCIGSLQPTNPLDKNTPWRLSKQVPDGSYMVRARNCDKYSVAAPKVTIEVNVTFGSKSMNLRKVIPSQCGWTRCVGVVGGGTIDVCVTCDAVLRECHIGVELLQLEENDPDEWMKSLPQIDDIAVDIELPTVPTTPPPARIDIQVQPKGVALTTRMELLRKKIDSWPNSNVEAVPLSKGEQHVLQAVHKLPIPTEICGDISSVDFTVHPEDFETR